MLQPQTLDRCRDFFLGDELQKKKGLGLGAMLWIFINMWAYFFFHLQSASFVLILQYKISCNQRLIYSMWPEQKAELEGSYKGTHLFIYLFIIFALTSNFCSIFPEMSNTLQ